MCAAAQDKGAVVHMASRMAPPHNLPLFHARLVHARVQSLDPSLFKRHQKTVSAWLEHLKSGVLDDTKETSLHGGFLERIFGDVLGYSTMATAKGGEWDLVAEKSVLSGGSADAALGMFSKGKSRVVAPIELKGAAQFLDHRKGRGITPIQQGWDYANKTPESRWIIISNYRETRLYAKGGGQAAYELFRLDDLATEGGFLRFVALLGREAMLGGPSFAESPLAQMLVASEAAEREVTHKLYDLYRLLRALLFDELRRVHSNRPPAVLLAYAQTILDRVLFLAFAEDRLLLPPETIKRACNHRDPYKPRPIWENFVAVFRSVDKGNTALQIPAYNGGLFRADTNIEELEISDDLCRRFEELATFDFRDDVSVDVLGHIFEQSITDLDQLRREAEAGDEQPAPAVASTGTQKKPSKRKLEGIFYTPPFVTNFLVRETLGHVIEEAWERASKDKAANKKARIATWQAYQGELRKVRVLDPACGSGAFLIAAFDVLAQQFELANRALAEMQAQQTSLFDLTKTLLNENLFGIDKSGESIEITKLSLWLKTAEQGKRLTFLDRNVRQGNSVVSEPKLDPMAFDWRAGRVARALFEPKAPGEDVDAIDARWREGFDVVLGNPPYIRQELLTKYKEHWGEAFQTYDGVADIFVYFFERGYQQLKPGGRLGYIVSNKWLRGGYAEKLRALFAKECTIETLVDFGHAPVFPDADAFPCIVTLRKEMPAKTHDVRVTLYPREELHKDRLASYVDTHRFAMPQSRLGKEGWTLEPPGVQALLEKLRANGVSLRDYAGVKPYYGIKTGCNEAFLVDHASKERLCREDPHSAEVLKKYLRGQDIARWAPEWAGLWMIFARRGIEIDAYPAIKAHLEKHRAALEPRPNDYKGNDWPGRKPGTYKWYEIQDAVDYFPLFEQPILLYPDILWEASFCLARGGMYTNNTAYILPSEDRWLLACLNSPIIWAYLFRTAQHAKDEALRMFGEYVLGIPIAEPDDAGRTLVSPVVDAVVNLTAETRGATAAVLDVLRVEYGIESAGHALDTFAGLGSDAFVAEVKKRRPGKGKPLSPTELRHLRTLFEDEAPAILAKRAVILAHERTIANAVHAAYGLTAADLALLRETAPPRMPPGW